jgi:hypothetical protein
MFREHVSMQGTFREHSGNIQTIQWGGIVCLTSQDIEQVGSLHTFYWSHLENIIMG